MGLFKTLSRRAVISGALAVGMAMSAATAMADTIKVAGIFTLPVEQQWISRIHIALNAAQERGDIEYTFSENVANTDYERVMREFAESGVDLIVGEVFGLERQPAETLMPEMTRRYAKALAAHRDDRRLDD